MVSANITPDLETGIGKWDAEFFRERFFDYKPYGKRLSETVRLGGVYSYAMAGILAENAGRPGCHLHLFAARSPVRNAVEKHPRFPKHMPAVR